MRKLKFIVDGQIIKQDPSCDFGGLVPGSGEIVEAEFSFSPEWRNYVKVAAFWSAMGKEYMPQEIDYGGGCIIPFDALKKRVFKVQVVGVCNGIKVRTNKVEVKQNGGKA